MIAYQLLVPLLFALGATPSPMQLSATTTPAVVASTALPPVAQARLQREFTLVAAGTEASAVSPSCFIVSSPVDLSRIVGLLHTSVRLPVDIDPSSPLVVVFAGQRPRAGHSVSVRSIEEDPSAASLLVEAVETSPKPGSHVAQVVTSPWEIVRLLPHPDSGNALSLTNCRLKGGLR
jgi:hypothetical protein